MLKYNLIVLALLFSLNIHSEEYYISINAPGVIVSDNSDNTKYSSCKELKEKKSDSVSKAYSITPTGSNSVAYNLYCDMTTDGGGWTMVAKQSNFGGSDFRLFNANTNALTDLNFNATSPGGIQSLFTHNQVMLLNNNTNYFIFNNTFSGLTKRGCSSNRGQSCELISKTLIKRMGLESIPNNATLTFTYKPETDMYSGIIFGTDNNNTWCSVISGKYIGMCKNGSYGIGNWAVFVR